jgi:hypothetical protein
MSDPEEDVVSSIAGAVREYFAVHPEAADSADGIQRWWLPPPLREEPLALVERAVERLVSEGVTRRVVLEDGRVIYANVRRAD